MTDQLNLSSPLPKAEDIAQAVAATSSGQATALAALQILVSRNEGYVEPTTVARRHIAMAFAGRGSVVYGKAFDIIRVRNGATINFDDLSSVEQHLSDIVLYEVKSTKRTLPADFSGYFFSLSTAELLVAQSVGDPQFRFAFVDTASRNVLDLSLTEVFARVRGIYPTWSIRF